MILDQLLKLAGMTYNWGERLFVVHWLWLMLLKESNLNEKIILLLIRYVTAGAAWLNGAFTKVAKAGQVAGSKTREKFHMAVSNLTAKVIVKNYQCYYHVAVRRTICTSTIFIDEVIVLIV